MSREQLIQHNIDLNNIKNNPLNSDDDIKSGYDLIKDRNPNKQIAMVNHLIKINGLNELINKNGDLSFKRIYGHNKRPYKVYDGEHFINDLLLHSNEGNILNLKLGDYNPNNMPLQVAKIYKTIEKLQYHEATKYNYLLDISKDAVEDEKLYNITNAIDSESTEEYKEYIGNGKKLVETDDVLEKSIKPTKDGIFQNNNGDNWIIPDEETRDLHPSGQDIRYTMSNNILSKLYGNTQLIPESVYFLATSDSVIEVRNKYFSTPQKVKITTKMLKNPKEAKKLFDEMYYALKKAEQNLKIPNGSNKPRLEDLAQMIYFVDSNVLPNHDHFYKNPASLGKFYADFQKGINPNNLASISNLIEIKTEED